MVDQIATDPPERDAWRWFVEAVALCYQRPAIVVRRMARYSATKGQDAFFHRLRSDPAHFGQKIVPPHPGSKSSSLPQRRASQQAAALLPLLAKDAFDAHLKLTGPADVHGKPQQEPVRRTDRRAATHVTAFTT